MHELGIMVEVVEQVEAVARRENISRVAKIVLQIGEAASVVPHFVRECFPAAVYQTSLVDTELDIEILPASGLCQNCKTVYPLKGTQGKCPKCQARNFELLSGEEFIIKEIVVADDGDETGRGISGNSKECRHTGE